MLKKTEKILDLNVNTCKYTYIFIELIMYVFEMNENIRRNFYYTSISSLIINLIVFLL